MKNKLIYSFLIILAGAFVLSCQPDDEFKETPAPSPGTLTSTGSSGSTVVLQQDNAEQVFTTFSWTATDFGGKPVKYSIEMDKTGNNFMMARDIVTTEETSVTLTVEDINAAVINYGLDPGETAEMEFRVRSWVDYIITPGVSNTAQFTLTPYLLTFPPIYVIGDAQAWSLDNAVTLTSTEPGIYTGQAKFNTNGKFRFFTAPDWASSQYGWDEFVGGAIPAEFADGNDNDDNFVFTGLSADYLVKVDINTRAITLELAGPPPPPASVFFVTAQTFDLGNAIALESGEPGVYSAILILEQNTKFRIFTGQSWTADKLAWSSFDVADELLQNSEDDVSNILFTGETGYYLVTVSLDDRSIQLEPSEPPSEILFLIGDPNGWQLDNTLAMRALGGNVFEVTAEFETGQIFRFFKELDWNADQFRWSTFTDGTVDSELEDGGGGDSNFRFAAASGIYKLTVSLSDHTINVEPAVAPTLHLIGDDQGWTPATAVGLTWMGGGLYQGSATFTNNAIFRFFANNDPVAWDWSGEQWRYSSFADGTIDSENLGDGGGGDSNFRFIGTTGTHTITVNINALTVDID